jgi:triosephosphate isomerase (TIM)
VTRRPIISGNWKMNLNHFEAIQTLQKLSYLIGKDDYAAVDVTVHVPFTDIRSVQTVLEADDIPIMLGAQHCHWEEKGAFTGEVSPHFLAKLNVKYIIVGHSERREIFGETDEMVARKTNAIQALGMTAIESKVLGQLASVLAKRKAADVANLVIAYEPIWAIGTGRTATAEDAQAVCGAIRTAIAAATDAETAAAVRIQYGGSVKASNIAELMACADIDGALVGGASLDPEEFARLIQFRLLSA